MSLLEVIRSWFKWSVPFAAKRRAVEFLRALPTHYRRTGRVRYSPGMVEVTWGRPSWFYKTVHVMIDKYAIHFWIHQGDRGGRLWELTCNNARAGAYMGNLLQRCGL